MFLAGVLGGMSISYNLREEEGRWSELCRRQMDALALSVPSACSQVMRFGAMDMDLLLLGFAICDYHNGKVIVVCRPYERPQNALPATTPAQRDGRLEKKTR